MTVLVTRPAQDARQTIEKLAERGIAALSAPVLEIVPVPDVSVPAGSRAILLTSANAAVALSGRPDILRLRAIRVFAVGDRTAEAARQAGFADVTSAGGTVADLIDLVRTHVDARDGPLVYLSGRDVSGDLDGDLRSSGYFITRVVVYEARPAIGLPAEASRALNDGSLQAVLFHSPRSAETFGKLTADAGLMDRLAGIPAVVMSDRVASAARKCGFRHIFVAEAPHESMLLATLEHLIKGGLEE